ncbi:MAG: hypothetical protein KatS3mg011_0905 [Acidimicrobiia bacterium]|nr:MAG: hypothetical protein KatS3mg011_0905 [Acidimicrobiia bacterium]
MGRGPARFPGGGRQGGPGRRRAGIRVGTGGGVGPQPPRNRPRAVGGGPGGTDRGAYRSPAPRRRGAPPYRGGGGRGDGRWPRPGCEQGGFRGSGRCAGAPPGPLPGGDVGGGVHVGDVGTRPGCAPDLGQPGGVGRRFGSPPAEHGGRLLAGGTASLPCRRVAGGVPLSPPGWQGLPDGRFRRPPGGGSPPVCDVGLVGAHHGGQAPRRRPRALPVAPGGAGGRRPHRRWAARQGSEGGVPSPHHLRHDRNLLAGGDRTPRRGRQSRPEAGSPPRCAGADRRKRPDRGERSDGLSRVRGWPDRRSGRVVAHPGPRRARPGGAAPRVGTDRRHRGDRRRERRPGGGGTCRDAATRRGGSRRRRGP